jgi:hypothetical protein
MIIKYFNSLDELVQVVCNELKGKWGMYGGVHVGRVFGLKRYADGSGELTDWDWEFVAYCSKVKDRLLLKLRKPILAFVRVGCYDLKKTVFYVYFNQLLFSKREVEEIISEFDSYIRFNFYAIKVGSG